LGFGGGDVDLYCALNNNCISKVDPTGEIPLLVPLVAVVIVLITPSGLDPGSQIENVGGLVVGSVVGGVLTKWTVKVGGKLLGRVRLRPRRLGAPSTPPEIAPKPGVGGNGAASELPNLSGKSPGDAVKALEDAGFKPTQATPTKGGWQTFKNPDGSQVDIHFPSGRVVRTAAPKYGPDGSRINKGQRLGPDGSETPRDLPHDQHPPETLGGN
jgi:hypothetical protein